MTRNHNSIFLFSLFFLLFTLLLSGCAKGGKVRLNPKNPVTLTIWHPYEQRMRANMVDLINEFNRTVGAEQGIIIQESYVTRNTEIRNALISAAIGVPGAPQLPDIAVVYPGVAMIMAEENLLVDLHTQFTAEELSQYVPAFLEEGTHQTALYIMPTAKSTEVMFINNTIFRRFAAESAIHGDEGVTLSRLATFEGILETAEKYHKWSGGKAFMYYTELFNYSLVALKQLGSNLFENNRFNLSTPEFRQVWNAYFPPAASGGLAIFDSFGSHLMATGETVCILDSTASIAFLSDTVTYSDNTKEDCELVILPYPVFENGTKAAIQQGAGMCVFKSNPKKEYAAAIFLKWFTQPQQNIRFAANIGYMPVTLQAFEEYLKNPPTDITGEKPDDRIIQLINTTVEMQKNYTFHFPPPIDGIEEMRINYERTLRTAAENAKHNPQLKTNALETFLHSQR